MNVASQVRAMAQPVIALLLDLLDLKFAKTGDCTRPQDPQSEPGQS